MFEILAKDAQASAAFARFRRTVDDTSRSVDANSSSLDKNARQLDRHKQSATSALGAVAGLGAAFSAMSAPVAAAGAGVAAFAGFAIPSVTKITKAITAPGGLAASWVTLDNRQRAAVTGVQALGDRYGALAKTLEPQVFQAFNTGLRLANSLLGPAGRLAGQAGKGFEDFLVQFDRQSGLQHFIGFLSAQARPALALLGSDVTHIAHALFQLIQSFAGPGLVELRLLSGVFTALDTSITFLSRHAPALTNVALTIGGITLALSKLGALSGVLKFTGLAGIAAQMTGFAAATKGATVAEKGLLASTAALDAISPFGWAVLGVAALTGLAVAIAREKDGVTQLVASLRQQDQATGANVSGWAKFAGQLSTSADVQQHVTKAIKEGSLATGGLYGNLAAARGATAAFTQAGSQASGVVRTLGRFLGGLQHQYGLTRSQTVALAKASGVQIDKNGKLVGGFAAATEKAQAYANANVRAQRPTSQLAQDMGIFANKTLTATDRVKGLTDALNLFFNPAVTADQDTIQLKDDQVALAKALEHSGGRTGLLTQKQRDARGAFDTYIGQVAQTAADTFKATGKTSDYKKIIDAALPILEKAAGHNKTLRAEIQKLIDTEKNLHAEQFGITVRAHGFWHLSQESLSSGGPGGAGRAPAAAGLFVRGGTPGRDSVPINAMPGEVVVPTKLVDAGEVDHLRGRIPGFARGGVVGSYDAAGIPAPGGLNKWLLQENAATVRAITNGLVVAMHRAASSGGGAIVRDAMRWLYKIPYVWSGTAVPGGADCSGFVQTIYGRHGIHAPRTSEAQGGWVRRSPPVPGGLAFYTNPQGGPPPGHVAIIGYGGHVISQGGGMGPQYEGLHGPGPLMFTGIPPGPGFARMGLRGFGGGFGGRGGNAPVHGGAREVTRSMAAARGWTGGQWRAINAVEMREAGWRLNARNPSSGAYGIAQFINGPGEYYSYGGNPNTAAGQATAFLNYIARRYGTPARAWAHEQRYNWYGRGTGGARPGWAWVGERGPELVRFHGGEQVLDHLSSMLSGATGGAMPGYAAGTPTRSQRLSAVDQVVSGNTTTAHAIRRAAEGIEHIVRELYRGHSRQWRIADAERFQHKDTRLADELHHLQQTIASARAYRSTVRGGLRDFGQLSNVPITYSGTEGGPLTAGLAGGLRGQLATIRRFGSLITQLRHAGLSPVLLRQVANMGPEQGTEYAQAILSAGPGGIRSLDRTEAALQRATRTVSTSVARDVYGLRGATFLGSLRRERAGIEAEMRHAARVFGREAARWLDVRVPRRHHHRARGGLVTEPVTGIGGWTGDLWSFGESGPEYVTPRSGYLPLAYNGTGRPGQVTPGTAARPRAEIHNHFAAGSIRETVDVALLGQQLSFRVASAGLGS